MNRAREEKEEKERELIEATNKYSALQQNTNLLQVGTQHHNIVLRPIIYLFMAYVIAV